MRIISKYKDYYDYLQGIYGIDDKLILDRSKGSSLTATDISLLKDTNRVQLAIMGVLFTMIYFDGKWYTERGLYNIGKRFGTSPSKYYRRSSVDVIKDISIDPKTGLPKPFNNENEFRPTNLNDKYDCPIIKVKDESLFPRLTDYNFASVISPEDMWINLYNWLSRVKEEPTEMSNKEKIVSHGFDLKTSFRNM